jgi:hypothetical protein
MIRHMIAGSILLFAGGALIAGEALVAGRALAADEVPRLAVEKSCRAAQQLEALSQPLFDACMRDERNAEAQLDSGVWRSAKASSRTTCAGSQESNTSQSYVELLTCVQMMDGTILRPADPK